MVKQLVRTGAIAALIALLLAEGIARLEMGATVPAAAQQAASSCSDGYALWADNLGGGSPGLDWSGSGTHVDGKVHANRDIRLSGSDNVITGVVEYVTAFADEGDANQYPPPVQVSPAIIPVSYDIAAYQPGGAAAIAAEQDGRYHYIDGTFEVSDGGVQLDGLYYVTGEVVLSGSDLHGTVTIVAEREIEISGSDQNFTPYSDGLLLFSTRSASSRPAIKISGSNSMLPGIIYAPNAQLEVSGSTNAFAGGLFGRTIRLNGSSLTIVFDEQYCPPAPPPPTPTPTPSPTNTPPPTPPPGTVTSAQFLPLAVANLSPTWGEPNNSCREAHAISSGSTHFFLAEDTHDWYHFTLSEPGEVTVRLSNFVPLEGQIAVWRGESCDATVFLESNGDRALNKTLSLGPQPAARFFIYVSNDGTFNATEPYSLRIDVE
jgi:hypothetical protein